MKIVWVALLAALVTAAPGGAETQKVFPGLAPRADCANKPAPGERTIEVESGGDGSNKKTDRITFSASEWELVQRPLATQAADAAAERHNIAQALLIFDRLLRKRTVAEGVKPDRGSKSFGVGWIYNQLDKGERGQMNCINIANNLMRVLRELDRDCVLKYHAPDAGWARRGEGLTARLTQHHAALVNELPRQPSDIASAMTPARWESMTPVARDAALRGYQGKNGWVFDRWYYDLGKGVIGVQKFAEWEAGKKIARKDEILLDAQWEELVGPPAEDED